MADGPVLTSRVWERNARLAFTSYQVRDAYISEFDVAVSADGLSASARVITTPDGYGLSSFLQDLADDFRGWDGTRSWRSLEDQLRIGATWQDGGHVVLVFNLTPSVYDKWTLSVEFTLEAGEELRNFGEDLAAFTAT